MRCFKALSFIKKSLFSALMPEICLFCGSLDLNVDSSICPECLSSLRWVSQPICKVCGQPLRTGSVVHPNLCGTCLSSPPIYDTARYGLYYESSVRAAITRFKFDSSLASSKPLAEFLVQTFYRYYADVKFDVILPAPLHTKRLLSRGFNQTVILSRRLSKATGIPLDRTGIIKIRNTEPQARLSRSKRLSNLSNAFEIKHVKQMIDKRVLIVDDVSTTGATITEAAKVVKKAGASYVGILVLALRTRDGSVKVDEDHVVIK